MVAETRTLTLEITQSQANTIFLGLDLLRRALAVDKIVRTEGPPPPASADEVTDLSRAAHSLWTYEEWKSWHTEWD